MTIIIVDRAITIDRLAVAARLLLTALAVLTITCAALLWGDILLHPEGNDWLKSFRPAITELFSGGNPYFAHGFLGPPWVLLPLAPLALLPPDIGLVVVAAINLFAFGYVAHRLGAKPLVIATLLVTPQVLWGSHMGNIDWMVALGLVMPPRVGLFFVLAKPQIGAPIALFWLVEAFRRGGLPAALKTFAPVSIALLASFSLYGLWPLQATGVLDVPWNISLFPYALPVGIALLAASICNRRLNLAIFSSPFFSPYLAVYSLPVAVLGLLPAQLSTTVALISLWGIWLLRGPM
jgi:hypothetical protein